VAGEVAALEAAFSRVVRLASENASALDSAARYMAANAWVGGGADSFADALSGQRARLQRAFETACADLAARIRALGGHVSVPAISTSAAVFSHHAGGFAGMDVVAMTRLVHDLDRAGPQLHSAGQRLTGELRAAGVPDEPGRMVGAAGAWVSGQVGDLRKRLTVIQKQSDSGLTSAGMAGFGLFGGYAPDVGGASKALAAAAAGNPSVLTTVIAAQRAGTDATLAARVAAWWQQLGAAGQDQLIAAAPRLIGSLNGLPAIVRSKANLSHLRQQQTSIGAQLAQSAGRISASGGHPSRRATPEFQELSLKMRQIDAVFAALAKGGINGRPDAMLLSLSLGGLGRTVISYGDPDTADTVVTSIPGTGTRLEGIGGDDSERAVRLWDQAAATAGKAHVASVLWFEYDAPQLDFGQMLDFDTSVAAPALAQGGASALDSFVDGLHAAHIATSDPRFTVLGHSYGSLVVGIAAQHRLGSFADQLILVGSPGVAARKANDLGVGQVWVGEAAHDPIADLGHVPLRATVEDGHIAAAFNRNGPFGTDPGDPAFGAHHFYVHDSTPWTQFDLTEKLGNRTITESIRIPYNIEAHSNYWDTGAPKLSTSLRNMAFIINGQYERLISRPVQTPSPSPQPSPTSPDAPTARPSPIPQPAPNPPGH
jgi:hypothetical protein